MKKHVKSIIAITLLSSSMSIQANEGVYLGLNLGQATYDASLDDFAFLDDGSIISADLDDKDSSFSITVGYQFTPNFSVEGGFIDLGELAVDAVSDGSGFLYFPGDVRLSAEVDGLFFNLKGLIPLNESFSLYGKFGLLKWDGEVTLSDATGSISGDDDGNDTFFGAGAAFSINNNFSLNIDYSLYDLDGDDVDVLSVGIQYKFQ